MNQVGDVAQWRQLGIRDGWPFQPEVNFLVLVVLRDFQHPAAGLFDLRDGLCLSFRRRRLGLRGLNEGSQ